MRKRNLFRTFVAVSVITSMMVTPVSATGLEEKKAAAQSQVSSLQEELTDLMTKIGNLQVELTEKGEEISKAESDLADAKLQEETQYEAMKLRIQYMYEDGNIAMVEKVLSSGTFAEMLTQVTYAGEIQSYDRDALIQYQETQKKIAELKSTLETDMASLQEMETDFQAQQESLDVKITSKRSEVADLDAQLQAAAAAAAQQVQAQRQANGTATDLTITTNNTTNTNNTNTSNNTNTNNNSNNNTNTNNNTNPAPAPDPEPDNSSDNSSGTDYSWQRDAIVSAAYSQIGVPYVWAGSTPGVGLDCSGLVQYCYRQAGIRLPHYSEDQMAGGRITYNPKPGDIVWKPGHVGIYIGGGKMIEAQQTGTNIMISNVRVQAYITYLD